MANTAEDNKPNAQAVTLLVRTDEQVRLLCFHLHTIQVESTHIMLSLQHDNQAETVPMGPNHPDFSMQHRHYHTFADSETVVGPMPTVLTQMQEWSLEIYLT